MKINNIEQISYFTIESDLRELFTNSKDILPSRVVCTYEIFFNGIDEFKVVEHTPTPVSEIIYTYFNSYNHDRIPFDEYEIFVSIDSEEIIVEIMS